MLNEALNTAPACVTYDSTTQYSSCLAALLCCTQVSQHRCAASAVRAAQASHAKLGLSGDRESYGCNIGLVCLLTISVAYTDQPSVLSENEGSIGGCRSGQRRRSIWHLWGPSSGQKWETVWWCTFKTSCLLQSTSSHKACSPARAPTRPRQSPTQPPSTLLKSPNRYNSVIVAFGMFNQRSSSLPHYVCKHHSSFLRALHQ